jgi:hypothetical protein
MFQHETSAGSHCVERRQFVVANRVFAERDISRCRDAFARRIAIRAERARLGLCCPARAARALECLMRHLVAQDANSDPSSAPTKRTFYWRGWPSVTAQGHVLDASLIDGRMVWQWCGVGGSSHFLRVTRFS